MTNLNVSNSSSDSSSASTSGSSSSGSSSSSSDSGSSSSDSESSTTDTPAVAPAQPEPVKSPKPVPEEPKKKDEKTKKAPVITKVSSSSEDETPKPVVAKPVPTRRRSSAKAKAAAAVNHKQTKPAQKTITEKKAPQKSGKTIKTESQGALKKKSIFSPDNSTESESEDTKKTPVKTPPTRGKGRPRKSSKDSQKLTPKKEPPPAPKEVPKRRSGSTASGPPPKKGSASSCTSSQSSTESDSASSSERETRKKAAEIKTGKTKPPPTKTKPKPEPVKPVPEEKPEATMPRKLTRSLSARVSRLATISRPTHTDTDSDNDERIAKAKANESKKGRRSAMKSPAPRLAPLQLPEPGERRCPVRGCDSLGHLGGQAEKHYTYDACPLYHNVTPAWCVAASEERAAAATARNKAVQAMQQRPRAQPTIEQRAYQLKVKDMRSKWKGSQEFRDKQSASGLDDCMNDEREPILEGFVPDYDMKLFREAQALAAINIEEELGDVVTDKGTRYVVMGKYMMEVWYQSPYPGEAARAPRLFVCEYCLNHQRCAVGAKRHRSKCRWRHPPGDEVYRDGALSVWQVDGRKHRQYCQQLCLLAKYFLDHKTLYYDVEPFLFYVMTVADAEGCHVVGYFSKEKNSFLNYNVSCILTLPPYQRQGYGRLLIDFSYLLTKVEGKVGSPETPLSDLGLISYRSYWKEALLKRLCSAPGPALCIRDLSKDLAIASCDIVSTLQERGLMKYWKGKHIVLKKQDVLEEVSRRAERQRSVEPSCLRWTPPAAPPPR